VLVLGEHEEFLTELSKDLLEWPLPGILLVAPDAGDGSVDDAHDELGVIFGFDLGLFILIALLLLTYR